ncbi:MAG: DUF2461 domain-containing protein [Hyphomicrobiales bacterium]
MSTSFSGFKPEALAFLRGLKANNDAAWFKPRKAIYDKEVKAPLAALVAALADAAQERGLPLTGDPVKSVFRIYRDIRFSKDKRPYRPVASAALTRSGSRHDPGVLYVHIEPGASFLACGFWQPQPELLDAWRKEMVRKPAKFLGLARAFEKKGLPLAGGEERKRLPRGFEAHRDEPIAPYLLWNSFVVDRKLLDGDVQSPDLPRRALAFAETCRPLLDYGWALEKGKGHRELKLGGPTHSVMRR